MSNADLIAPARLRGPMSKSSRALLADRRAWIMAQVGQGRTCRQIGAALGISAHAVSLTVRRAGGVPPREPRRHQPQPGNDGGLLRFKVAGITPAGDCRSHVIRAETEEAAAIRWAKAYPAGAVESIELLGGEVAE